MPSASAPDRWNPARYQQFRAERAQPFQDLLGLITKRPAGRVVDLGCGPGGLTAQLHETLAAIETIGVDSSPAMLAEAASLERPGLRFVQADLRTWRPDAPVDVVFSNAALQWVNGHEELLPKLLAILGPGGELAVQMPANFDHPSHRIAAELAAEEPFAAAMGGYVRQVPVLSIEDYATLLRQAGAVAQHVRLQVYGHELESTSAVVDWVRGTLLTDYEVRMPAAMYADFLQRYRDRLLDDLGEQTPYFYAFKRILFWARISAAAPQSSSSAPAGAGPPPVEGVGGVVA